MDAIRIDKWLWAVRLYKTRSKATEACQLGKVKIDGKLVKPSRDIKTGDTIEVNIEQIKKTIKVTGIIKTRVSATLAAENMQDLTPPEEYERIKTARLSRYEIRDRGVGRPTKKERRLIDKIKKID